MDPFYYSKHRRLEKGLFWLADTPPASVPLYVRLLDAAFVVLVLCGLIALLCWMQARDYEDQVRLHQEQVRAQEEVAISYGATLAACMNGGALWDAIGQTAYFCSKPLALENP